MTHEEFVKAMEVLAAPIENPKWRVQSCYPREHPTTAVVVPYIDSRMVQERLDTALGPDNWSNTYDPESGAASISIKIDGEWITKADVGGTDLKISVEKSRASDAFKRAAVMWGIGRDVYKLGDQRLKCDQYKNPLTSKGEALRTPSMLSNYMNKMNESEGCLYRIWLLNENLHKDDNFKALLGELKTYVKNK